MPGTAKAQAMTLTLHRPHMACSQQKYSTMNYVLNLRRRICSMTQTQDCLVEFRGHIDLPNSQHCQCQVNSFFCTFSMDVFQSVVSTKKQLENIWTYATTRLLTLLFDFFARWPCSCDSCALAGHGFTSCANQIVSLQCLRGLYISSMNNWCQWPMTFYPFNVLGQNQDGKMMERWTMSKTPTNHGKLCPTLHR